MEGIGPELPLQRSTRFGNYGLLTSYRDQIEQNFKTLLLTSPGERIMNTDFGCGLRRYLFEPRVHVEPQIRSRIQNQVRKYMPFVRIIKISFNRSSILENVEMDQSQTLSVSIEYDVPSLNLNNQLVLQSEEIF
jgi:phage baseplate assembly protein W